MSADGTSATTAFLHWPGDVTHNAFTAHVVKTMQELFPEALADSAWDNVGLLLENLPDGDDAGSDGDAAPRVPTQRRVLLTNDLTPDVVDEAISHGVSVIIAYHPVIFRGLKRITRDDVQQTSLLRLMQNNIAVYCPHTALDAGAGGINDWLVQAAMRAARVSETTGTTGTAASLVAEAVQPVAKALPETYHPLDATGAPAAVGYGRKVMLPQARHAHQLIRDVVRQLGLPMQHVLVARPRATAAATADSRIYGVAVCAGSGYSVLRDLPGRYNMLITGEASHHDVLHATTRGCWVVCLLHSNSERRYLAEWLQPQLAAALQTSSDVRAATVLVSKQDRDPFEIWDIDNPPQETSPTPEAYSV